MLPSQLLSSPKRWTQGCSARDKRGMVVSPCDRDVVCWCVMGAIRKCAVGDKQLNEWMCKLIDVIGLVDITIWNDDPSTIFKEVKAALKKAGI